MQHKGKSHRLSQAVMLICALAALPPVLAAAPAPTAVTLDGVLNADSDSTPVFTRDGATAFFDRTVDHNKSIMVSRRVGGRWGAASVAPFSGIWLDQDPAIAPDGSFLVFSSNRPVQAGGPPVAFVDKGKSYRGANLWKVARQGEGWGAPVWLGAAVNASTLLVAPSITADGSVYFIQRRDGAMHIFRSQYRAGAYLPAVPVPLGDPALPTHDPAVAPDESFLVFDYGVSANGLGRLSIAFRKDGRWSAPQDLGEAVNRESPWGARLGADGRTVYFTGADGIWSFVLPQRP